MGNIKKWQGPLSDSWHKNTLALQHKILKRMREFGMIPILPAFAGHVPPALTRRIFIVYDSFLGPEGQSLLPNWSRFYKRDGARIQRYDHFYNCDTFNEMTPSSGTTSYLRNVGKAVFKAMTTADTQAVW
ncbi:Alpha-N-acetylglucosaminidase [Armadillidium vulgare]|nr:Alpha-N-acetylglucosaminidase [Armadillidium vulgare]